jgi:hypothetical protein
MIAKKVFGGRKTGSAVKGKWEWMKRKYRKAKNKLASTGEGQRDDLEKWSSIKLAWLDDVCPWYEEMCDILDRYEKINPAQVLAC